ncbi:hypothetical protein CGRA01v4_14859 [Colletotrichum graminicola]|nr:hypothetical protein CGRA01v4_14859 [Colletotrichum graminicola]
MILGSLYDPPAAELDPPIVGIRVSDCSLDRMLGVEVEPESKSRLILADEVEAARVGRSKSRDVVVLTTDVVLVCWTDVVLRSAPPPPSLPAPFLRRHLPFSMHMSPASQ